MAIGGHSRGGQRITKRDVMKWDMEVAEVDEEDAMNRDGHPSCHSP